MEFELAEQHTETGVGKATWERKGILLRSERNEFGWRGGALNTIHMYYSAKMQCLN